MIVLMMGACEFCIVLAICADGIMHRVDDGYESCYRVAIHGKLYVGDWDMNCVHRVDDGYIRIFCAALTMGHTNCVSG